MSAVPEIIALYILLVDRTGYQGVDQLILQVVRSMFKCEEGGVARLSGGFTQFDPDIFVDTIDDIDPVVTGFRSMPDAVQVQLLHADRFFVVGCNFRGAIDYRGAYIEQTDVFQRFKDYLITDSVDIPVGYSDGKFFAHDG